MNIIVQKKQGYYCGTEVDGKWWKRYTKKGFFSRGLGIYWIDDSGLYFQKYLTKNPFIINFSDIKDIKTGKWHSGRWGHGYLITKIIWYDGIKNLSSGFLFSKEQIELEKIHTLLKSHSGTKL